MYPDELVRELETQYPETLHDLEMLFLRLGEEAYRTAIPKVRDHLHHGVGRRLSLLKIATQNIFSLFPLDQSTPLPLDNLLNTQLNLHAFVVNLYGVFENLAWAFVSRHGLESQIRNRMRISLFKTDTQRYLPREIKDYVTSDQFQSWYDRYLKNYRDALAHRIPLYIPPAQWTPDERDRYQSLESEKFEILGSYTPDGDVDADLARVDEITTEQNQIGDPCPTFLHSFIEQEDPQPVLLHPQLLTDCKSVTEFGQLFLQHWHNRGTEE